MGPSAQQSVVGKTRKYCHDRYTIAVMKHLPGRLVSSVVGHLPREISRFTHFIIVHGAKVSCKVVGCASKEITTCARFENTL